MSEKYLKADLVAELAAAADIPKTRVETLLAQLAQIAYREARDGFILPGICKLDVVRRKGRYGRIPHSGQRIYIAERDALRVRALSKAKHAVAPMKPGMVQFVEEDATTPPPPPAATESDQYNPEGLVSFRCGGCGQEIEAPFDMAGTLAQCPACSGSIEVPYVSEPGTLWGRSPTPAPAAAPVAAPAATPVADSELQMPTIATPLDEAKLGRTIRIELPDDI